VKLCFKQREIRFPRRPLVMGIVNVNDDSFCDDGSLDHSELEHLVIEQINAGADIIDVGAESARTNRAAISIGEEVGRFQLFFDIWQNCVGKAKPKDNEQVFPPILSLNTWRTEVIAQILPLGGELLNDMSALPNAENAKLAAKHDVSLLLMHSVGEPKVAHKHVQWENIIDELCSFFEEKIKVATAAGVNTSALILDPGIDFAKQKDDNLLIYRNLTKLKKFNCPILLPVSRKTVVGEVLAIDNPLYRDAGSAACVVQGVLEGASIFRVHDVSSMFDVVKLSYGLIK